MAVGSEAVGADDPPPDAAAGEADPPEPLDGASVGVEVGSGADVGSGSGVGVDVGIAVDVAVGVAVGVVVEVAVGGAATCTSTTRVTGRPPVDAVKVMT